MSHAAPNGARSGGRRSSRREAGSTWLSGTADGVGPNSRDEFDRARAAFPGGVNSPVRAFGSVGGTPLFVASALGAYLTDVDGREFVDLVCSWGPALLGHAHPDVVRAVQELSLIHI